MRLFIAAPLPENILAAILEQQAHYNQEGVRLVPGQNLHLTLHFIGEVPAGFLPVLTQQLEHITADLKSFTLSFKEIAPGPKLKNPRLVWLRFQEHPEFTRLAKAIEETLASPSDHPGEYIPHITIARLKKDKPRNLNLPVIQNILFPEYQVNAFSIWQSELGSPHPRYSILQNFPLLPS